MSDETPAAINRAARTLADALEAAAIPYALGGALAYGYWGAARGTKDVDLNVFVPMTAPHQALDVLMRAGLEVGREEALRTLAERGDVRGHAFGVPVDVFFDSIPLHPQARLNSVVREFLGRPVRVLSAEDLTILKLFFNRPKDLLDVERLVALQGNALDRGYVRRWLVDGVGEDDVRVRWWDELCRQLPAERG